MTLSALAALLLLAAPAEASPFRAAVIVGVNAPFTPSQPTLQYADDDAARYYELFAPELDRVELLTVLDAESQPLFPEAARAASAPTRARLEEAFASVASAIQIARAEGRRTELYFVYTGHGRERAGEGEVRLYDAVLGRAALLGLLEAARPVDRVHLIVDACDAYHLVNARGDEALEVRTDLDLDFERAFAASGAEAWPEVGMVLSTRGSGPTHEWSLFRGGIFSHEVRSGLVGGADADEDGAIGYGELEAFIAAANRGVPVPKGRPRVFVRGPSVELGAPLFRPRAAWAALEVPAGVSGHYYLEDDRGLRYAELHKAEGYALRLRLVERASYEVRRPGGEVVQRLAPLVERAVLEATPGVRPREARGDDGAPPIFLAPFGPAFVAGYVAREPGELDPARLVAEAPPPVERVSPSRVAAFGAGGLAVAAASLSLWQSQEARARYGDYRGAYDDVSRDRHQDAVERARGRAWALGGAAGALAVGSLLLFLVDAVEL